MGWRALEKIKGLVAMDMRLRRPWGKNASGNVVWREWGTEDGMSAAFHCILRYICVSRTNTLHKNLPSILLPYGTHLALLCFDGWRALAQSKPESTRNTRWVVHLGPLTTDGSFLRRRSRYSRVVARVDTRTSDCLKRERGNYFQIWTERIELVIVLSYFDPQ